ncbi:MAG: plantaricin C family lantibiotic [Lachnospiraceae bacterium]|nr:plantaricin C family lantibiotic [Lachnospiraceae bacterium]
MRDLRNPMNRTNTMNPAGNVMKEMQEAELSRITAGAGETRDSGGVLCTSTAECYMGTVLFFCCP